MDDDEGNRQRDATRWQIDFLSQTAAIFAGGLHRRRPQQRVLGAVLSSNFGAKGERKKSSEFSYFLLHGKEGRPNVDDALRVCCVAVALQPAAGDGKCAEVIL